MTATRLLLLTLAIALVACKTESTSIRIELVYDTGWSLDAIEVAAPQNATLDQAPIERELLVTVPDGWGGHAVDLELWGLRAGEHAAYATVQVTPVLGREIAIRVELAALPCGAWCTEGAVMCIGDGVAVCEQRDADSCMEWSTPVACGVDAPFCSLGVCADECIDECADGETICDGPGAVRTCGEADSDSCRDWAPAVDCEGGAACTSGACAGECIDECEPGETRCTLGGWSACDDLDHDGCREWGPVQGCPEGETCSGGTCSSTCTHDCNGPECNGLVLSECGQFDLDPCRDLSPGTSCVPADPCREGMCTPGGCTSAPLVCEDPQPNTCIDADTLLVYEPIGTCSAGGCDYPSHEVDCPAGCMSGACLDPPGCTPTTGWSQVTIQPLGIQTISSIAVDSNLRVHIAYQGREGSSTYTLRYATKSAGGSWNDVAVDTGLSTGGGDWPSLALDPATEQPHIASLNFSLEVHHSWKTGAGWNDELVADNGDGNPQPTIAFDPAGTLHLVHQHEVGPAGQGQSIRYRRKTGSTWSNYTQVAADADQPMIVGDATGKMHLVASVDGELGYFRRPAGGNWDAGISLESEVWSRPDAFIDANGGLHVVYRESFDPNTSAYNVRYAYRPASGGGTTYHTIAADAGDDDEPWGSGEVAVAVDGLGRVHVAFYAGDLDQLRYAVRSTAGTWSVTSVNAGGHDPDLAIDELGGVHLSYWRESGLPQQRYAYTCPGP